MRTDVIVITNSNKLINSEYLMPQAIKNGWGFSLRPYVDTYLYRAGLENGGDPTSGYKFANSKCPLPPAPLGYRALVHFRDGSRKTLYVFDGRPFYFEKPFAYVDLSSVGWYSRGVGGPTQLVNGVSCTLAVQVFEGPGDGHGDQPAQEWLESFQLFDSTTPVNCYLPIPAAIPYGTSPSPKNAINFWGLNDECALDGGSDIPAVGAFYVFPQFRRWRAVLYAVGGAQDVQIRTLRNNGPAHGTVSPPGTNAIINETIPAGSWNADNTIVLERECAYANEWIQLVASTGAAKSVALIDAQAIVAL